MMSADASQAQPKVLKEPLVSPPPSYQTTQLPLQVSQAGHESIASKDHQVPESLNPPPSSFQQNDVMGPDDFTFADALCSFADAHRISASGNPLAGHEVAKDLKKTVFCSSNVRREEEEEVHTQAHHREHEKLEMSPYVEFRSPTCATCASENLEMSPYIEFLSPNLKAALHVE